MNGMEVFYDVLVVLHLLGMAAVVGAWFTVIRAPRIVPGMVYGALVQLVTGLVMVGLLESGAVSGTEPLDRAKIAVKLGVAIIVAVLAWVNRRRPDPPRGVVHAIGVLAVVNVLVAALWA